MKRIENPNDEVGEKQFDLVMDNTHGVLHPRIRKHLKQTKSRGWQFISLAGELGFDIALPMVGGLAFGKFVDGKLGTHPKATLVSLGIGCIISCTSLIRIVKDAQKKR